MGRLRLAHVTKQTGITLVETLVASLVMGIAIIGVSLMYGTGSSWVVATGEGRVATGLAQQMIEQKRAGGFPVPETRCETVYPDGSVAPCASPVDPSVRAFTRVTCVQYVSDADSDDPAYAYTPECRAGDPPTKNTVRVTVTVTSTRPRAQANAVTLQAWLVRP